MTIYAAAKRERISLFGAVGALKKQISTHRWHISQMFARDFKGSYQMTRFGVVWNYILPMVPITVWVLLSGLRMFPTFDGVSSVAYVTMGVTLWFLFSGFVTVPIGTIESKIREGAKSELPMIGFVIAGFAQLLFDTLVRAAAASAVFVFFQGAPKWPFIAAPVIILFAFLFFGGLGMILAIFNLAYRDINKVVTMLLQYGMLLSAIVFSIDRIPILGEFSPFNPFFVFVDSIRTLAVFGELRHPTSLAGFSIAGVIFFLFACKLFYVSEQRLKGFA
ncbi:MAG: ABC transporter permease [Parvularculaceae bacterium]|nr:ABC transporter permease [Parvularculaceae bacterium]